MKYNLNSYNPYVELDLSLSFYEEKIISYYNRYKEMCNNSKAFKDRVKNSRSKTWLAFQIIGKHARSLLSLENLGGKRLSHETVYVLSFRGQLPKTVPSCLNLIDLSLFRICSTFLNMFFLMLPKNWEKFKVRVFEFCTDLQLMRSTKAKG